MQRNGAAQCHGRKLRAIGGNHQTDIVVADMEIYDHELELVLIIPTMIGIDKAGLAVGKDRLAGGAASAAGVAINDDRVLAKAKNFG